MEKERDFVAITTRRAPNQKFHSGVLNLLLRGPGIAVGMAHQQCLPQQLWKYRGICESDRQSRHYADELMRPVFLKKVARTFRPARDVVNGFANSSKPAVAVIKVRGKAGVEEIKGWREQSYHAIPYGGNRATLVERIAQW